MTNRDGILDSHPSERVKMPPELAAFDRWDADRNDLAKWEAAMAALAPDAGADELSAARDELALADDGRPQAVAIRKLAALVKAAHPLPAASFRLASAITDPKPRPVLRAAGMNGAVLAEGAVCLLSGAGGSAKSTLATTLALDLAFGGQLVEHDGLGLAEGFSRLFDVRPGEVMATQRGAADAILARVHVAHFAGLPLWGTPAGGHYNVPPVPLGGWGRMWDAADQLRPALVVIDPALDAYTGDPNNLPAVREFVSALAAEASSRACGVVLVAHSRKAARGADADPYDPGQVGGVGAWADAARGVLTLTGRGDDRTLAISKANWGRAYVQTQLTPVATEAGALVGFDAGSDGWGPPPPKSAAPTKNDNGNTYDQAN